MRRLWILIPLLLLAAGANAEDRPIHVGDHAPAFGPLPVANTAESGQSSVSFAGSGQITVLSFFAGWCPGCVNEMPALTQLFKEYRGRVQVVSVSVDQSPDAAARLSELLQRDHVEHPVAIDADQTVLHAYQGRNMSLPYLMVIDSAGVVRLLEEGFSPSTESKVKQVLNGLLRHH